MSFMRSYCLIVATLCTIFVVAHAKPDFHGLLPKGRGPQSLTYCHIVQEKAQTDKSAWIPTCKGYQDEQFALQQCNRKGNLCWCSDLWGDKLNNPQPKKENMCQKPCFQRQSKEWIRESTCDKDGFFQPRQNINFKCFCYSKDGKVQIRVNCLKLYKIRSLCQTVMPK